MFSRTASWLKAATAQARRTLCKMQKQQKIKQRSTATLHLDSIAKTIKKLLLISTVSCALTVAPKLTNAQINIFQCGPPHSDCPTSPCDSHTHLCMSGGTSPYTYLWNPTGQTTLNISGVCPGQYTLTVTDAMSTTGIGIYFISQYVPLTVSCTANPTTITAGNSSTITTSASGGNPPYTYNWSFGNTYNPIVVSPSVTTCYTVTAVDVNGCTESASICVTVNPTGINDYINNISFTFSPNPFSTQTTLQTDRFLKSASLTVYNSFGQTVKQIDDLSGRSITIHRDNLPSGLYFICLSENNQTIATEKLLITD